VVEYVASPVTVWDKEFILVDEINRCEPSMQSKWLTLIRSREIMGFPTQVKWVWAAPSHSILPRKAEASHGQNRPAQWRTVHSRRKEKAAKTKGLRRRFWHSNPMSRII